MPVLRWGLALAFLLCLWTAFALPALGIILAIRRPPALPDGLGVPVDGRIGASRLERVGADAAGPGLWHLHLDGSPAQIGWAHGALAGHLTARIEDDLLAKLPVIAPSFLLRHALLGSIGLLTRSLATEVRSDEHIALAAGAAAMVAFHDHHRRILPHYSRSLQYHALHDFSHLLIDHPLLRLPNIGCTAVAVRGSASADGHLLVGRLFDFEGGTAFDDDKVVMTVRPEQGLAYVSVAWAGMSGAVTGMNAAGLWVSINAADTRRTRLCGRPIVLAAREILSTCRTISEAEAVLRASPVFVSAAVVVASRSDDRAVVIEVGPSGCALRAMADDRLVVANHFDAAAWDGDAVNAQRRREGTSTRRAGRAATLLTRDGQTAADLLALLRDRRGPAGEDLGFGNRGTINAWIGAHLVVADVSAGVLWVCEPAHGLGRALAFTVDGPLASPPLPAHADLAVEAAQARSWAAARDAVRRHLAAGEAPAATELADLLTGNPRHYEAHWLAGLAERDPAKRRRHLDAALSLQPAYPAEARRIASDLAATPATAEAGR